MLNMGDKAPDFTLDGCWGRTVTLSKRKTDYTVIVFYPKNNTPG